MPRDERAEFGNLNLKLISQGKKEKKEKKANIQGQMTLSLERMFLNKNVEDIGEKVSARKPQDIELTYETAAGRKNVEVFDKIFNAKLNIKKKYQRDINKNYLGAYKNNQFVQELNTQLINSRKHAFKKNRVSASVISDHYEGITRTEFEERLNIK